ncbi:hypothetical protein Tco_0866583 [Tanacetum coccineum]
MQMYEKCSDIVKMESSPLMNAMAVKNVVENESHFSLEVPMAEEVGVETVEEVSIVEGEEEVLVITLELAKEKKRSWEE